MRPRRARGSSGWTRLQGRDAVPPAVLLPRPAAVRPPPGRRCRGRRPRLGWLRRREGEQGEPPVAPCEAAEVEGSKRLPAAKSHQAGPRYLPRSPNPVHGCGRRTWPARHRNRTPRRPRLVPGNPSCSPDHRGCDSDTSRLARPRQTRPAANQQSRRQETRRDGKGRRRARPPSRGADPGSSSRDKPGT